MLRFLGLMHQCFRRLLYQGLKKRANKPQLYFILISVLACVEASVWGPRISPATSSVPLFRSHLTHTPLTMATQDRKTRSQWEYMCDHWALWVLNLEEKQENEYWGHPGVGASKCPHPRGLKQTKSIKVRRGSPAEEMANYLSQQGKKW